LPVVPPPAPLCLRYRARFGVSAHLQNAEMSFGAGKEEEQETPLSGAMAFLHYSRKLVFCLMYIVISAVLIRFNKMLMHKDRFPHAMALSAIHMLTCSIFCAVLYAMYPPLFPGMESTKGQRWSLMKWFVPIGCCFAVMLFCSNQAYLYCSVTFLQFMKEANVMLVFIFSCLIGLQSFTRLRCLVIVWVIVGAALAVSGEVHFAWIGFVFQGVSQLAEVSRMLMGEIVLTGRKLDPLSYNMILAPICLFVLVIANAIRWSEGVVADFARLWPVIIANACVAFCLNISVAAVIKECSAVGFVLAGLTKDIAIVLFSAVAFREHVTRHQAFAFIVTIAGVAFWSYMKLYPSARIVQAMEMLLGVMPATPGEKAKLLDKDDPVKAAEDSPDAAAAKKV